MNKQTLLRHLEARGFSAEILKAFHVVKREDFLPLALRRQAYLDEALPLGIGGATLSQPSTIAFMLSLLDIGKGQRVLEIGSGSGYVLSLLAELVGTKGRVVGVDIVPELVALARGRLRRKRTVTIVEDNGLRGVPDEAPFDRIIVSAAAHSLETVQRLSERLKRRGVLVAPVRNALVQLKKKNGKTMVREFQGFVFVPLREA